MNTPNTRIMLISELAIQRSVYCPSADTEAGSYIVFMNTSTHESLCRLFLAKRESRRTPYMHAARPSSLPPCLRAF